MKAELMNKISSYVFYVLMAISAVVLILFFLVGFDNTMMIASGPATAPEHTDTLMWWMYVLTAACLALMAVFSFLQFCASLKTNPKGAIKGILSLVLFVLLFGGAYALADDAAITINGKAFAESGTLIFTDVCIYVQYVLLGVATLLTILSLIGVAGLFNKIKA